MAAQSKHPLLVICGPTASGKSELAMKVAERFNGEIICADSRTVYKGMDIGTAKPSPNDQKKVKHHLLDAVNPDESFSVYDFQKLANVAIADIHALGKLPILVGGTGLYIDSIILNYRFSRRFDQKRQENFERMSVEELHEYCNKNNIVLPNNRLNKRYIITNIRRNGVTLRKRKAPPQETLVVGISTERDSLRKKFISRNEHFFEDGVVNEAKKLGEMYGWDHEAMKANIYRSAQKVLAGELSREEAIKKTATLDWRLAKRQMTWLKRHSFIQWYSLEEAEKYLFSLLAKT